MKGLCPLCASPTSCPLRALLPTPPPACPRSFIAPLVRDMEGLQDELDEEVSNVVLVIIGWGELVTCLGQLCNLELDKEASAAKLLAWRPQLEGDGDLELLGSGVECRGAQTTRPQPILRCRT